MNVRVSRKVAEAVGVRALKRWVNNEESWSYRASVDVSLAAMSPAELSDFENVFIAKKDALGVKTVLSDIAVWKDALAQRTLTRVKAVRQFAPLLTAYLAGVPGHRVYQKFNENFDIWVASYVNEIHFIEENRHRDYTTPAHVNVELYWDELGGRKEETLTFWKEDCVGITVAEALSRKGFQVETGALRKQYLQQCEKFAKLTSHVGLQLWATGTATDDLDGNTKRESSWYWSDTNIHAMERDGERSRVVVDVFYENPEKNQREKRLSPDSYFWVKTNNSDFVKALTDSDDVRETHEVAADLNLSEETEIEVPIHPLMAVFDLKRHLRLRIHVDHVTPYEYDSEIAERLVLPAEQKDIVQMLIHHGKSTFKDIIRGKSGGAVVLLTGAPGTGKTLTAEVFAESEQRALYSVQCSQLGTDPNEIEDALLKVFARAKRWNAVTLLDEADVYIHERGEDLAQNAIVGVFLRVLEYQDTILFLTTNRPNDVDDAIASRAVARLSYQSPTVEAQKKIWLVLAESAGIKLSAKAIHEIANNNVGITGRDVKNLLKLAAMISGAKKEPVTAQTVEFVKKFKPTGAQ